jgi:hypothetical protein
MMMSSLAPTNAVCAASTRRFGFSKPLVIHQTSTPRVRTHAASQDNNQSNGVDIANATVGTENQASEISFEERIRLMGQRYDFLSAGLPSLAVVSVFVANGQDPWKALSIAFTATVVSVVVNEIFFDGRCD